ncbi:MAG: PAS domain-containing protein [Anaerolineae bacterium]
MSQKEIEVILARHLASYLAVPMFIVDPNGTLIYYNEPAEGLLGLRYEEAGEMLIDDWSTRFTPTDDLGAPLPTDALPLAIALRKRETNNGRFWICTPNGLKRHLEVTAFPLIGQEDRYLGAVALFWELNS